VSRVEGGGIVVADDTLYHASVGTPAINVVTLGGELIRSIDVRPSGFRPVAADVSPRSSSATDFRELRDALAEATTVKQLLRFDQDRLFISFVGRGGYRYAIVNRNGTIEASHVSRDVRYLFAFRSGIGYQVVQDPVDDKGELPNPRLRLVELTWEGRR
jgi:hypothetical protein